MGGESSKSDTGGGGARGGQPMSNDAINAVFTANVYILVV